ncbi:MAG TPA: DUF4399 domain-containing protein, partial [Acidimicrobiales bacterium]|nr:DUF4399 domain-containing protein [Acidimicrobiales bacterium]
MTRSTRLLAIPFALALLATACGDDDQQPAMSGDVAESETDTTVTPDDTDTTASASEGSASLSAPEDGATVARRFTVEMTAEGIEIEPAGEVRDGAGHFHVMVDAGCVEPGEAIPKDDQHLHFGGGQLEAQLFLEPGEHELCLQVADGAHVALPITDEITVNVDGEEPYVTLEVPEGETATSPLPVTMTAEGIEIEPAGEVRDGAGHFHVMVDVGCVEA